MSFHLHFGPGEQSQCAECNLPRDFQQCSVDGCVEPATYILYQALRLYGGTGSQFLFYCEPHGIERVLRRGIPVRATGSDERHNFAEPISRCVGCGAPMDSGHVCVGCANS